MSACFEDNAILLGQTLVDVSGQAVKITKRGDGFRVSAVNPLLSANSISRAL
jgi:hypothetical protein